MRRAARGGRKPTYPLDRVSRHQAYPLARSDGQPAYPFNRRGRQRGYPLARVGLNASRNFPAPGRDCDRTRVGQGTRGGEEQSRAPSDVPLGPQPEPVVAVTCLHGLHD